jgi:hypothetical protein
VVRARVTKSPLEPQARKADPQIDRLARQIAERRRDLSPATRRELAKQLALCARTFALPNSDR